MKGRSAPGCTVWPRPSEVTPYYSEPVGAASFGSTLETTKLLLSRFCYRAVCSSMCTKFSMHLNIIIIIIIIV